MSILCGTDFSVGTQDAVRVAAALAARGKGPLRLVHAIERPVSAAWDEDHRNRARAAAALRLHDEAERARGVGATPVEESLGDGPADELLVSQGAAAHASLIVLGAVARRSGAPRRVAGTAERVTASTASPVLVVRAAPPIEAWLRGERPLKVVVGDDLTPACSAALRWTADLRRLGPCEIVACHVFSLLGEKSRLGIGGSLYARIGELEQANLAALRRHAGASLGAEGVRYRVEGTLGRAAEPLLEIASDESADLVVVGTAQRTGFGRAWHGWASQIVLNDAHANVACIPSGEIRADARGAVSPLRRVLVTTDFSPVGNHAVAYAYSIVADGGTVHLLHVEEPGYAGSSPEGRRLASAERLRQLTPESIPGKDVQSRLEVVADSDVPAAISAAAERLDVDVVCMGTHGRSGLSRVVLGSVAQAVAERSRCQVLLVPPRREGS